MCMACVVFNVCLERVECICLLQRGRLLPWYRMRAERIRRSKTRCLVPISRTEANGDGYLRGEVWLAVVEWGEIWDEETREETIS